MKTKNRKCENCGKQITFKEYKENMRICTKCSNR